jgi:hypothetical protein
MRFSIATLLVTLVPLLGVYAAPTGDALALAARDAAPASDVGSIEFLDKRVPAQYVLILPFFLSTLMINVP